MAEDAPKAQETADSSAKDAPKGTADPKADGQAPKAADQEPERPKPKEYTPEEIDEIAKKVSTPGDQTPPYSPKNVLSKEFAGTSSYEHGLAKMKKQAQDALRSAKSGQSAGQVRRAQEGLDKIECLYENYHIGMNVFRTAKGGRDKLRV